MLDARQIAEIVRRQDHDPGVSPSTLHYYVQVGILPPAVGRGRSGYTPEHLTRFRLARRLKREGISLAQIRQRLGQMSPAEVAAALAPAPAPTELDATAVPYTVAPPRAMLLGETAARQVEEAATRYSIATEALRARPGDTPRTLRFRGGFSLQVPAGTGDDQIARLYTAIEAALDQTASEQREQSDQEDEVR